SVRLSVLWADTAQAVVAELNRKDVPVLLDLSKGAAVLQMARDIRSQIAHALLFAVVDSRRPDLTTEAVLAGMADVFARPLGGRRVASALARELGTEGRPAGAGADSNGDELYHHSAAMRDVMALVGRAASMRAGVVVVGEEGTGRHMVARAIHTTQSPCAEFVRVDCAAHGPDELDA